MRADQLDSPQGYPKGFNSPPHTLPDPNGLTTADLRKLSNGPTSQACEPSTHSLCPDVENPKGLEVLGPSPKGLNVISQTEPVPGPVPLCASCVPSINPNLPDPKGCVSLGPRPKGATDVTASELCGPQHGQEYGPRWYHSVPLPSVEPVDPAILGDMPEVEGDEEDVRVRLEGLRLAAIAALKDQETALAKDMQAGSQVLAEATANLIARGNAEIQVLEGDLEYLANCENYDPEIEGPQNQDVSLRSITVEEGEQLWQTKIVSITDVMADIKSWTPALEVELLSLTEVNEATGVITEDEVRALEADPELHVVRLPGKIVAVIKPPKKKKARLVACEISCIGLKIGDPLPLIDGIYTQPGWIPCR